MITLGAGQAGKEGDSRGVAGRINRPRGLIGPRRRRASIPIEPLRSGRARCVAVRRAFESTIRHLSSRFTGQAVDSRHPPRCHRPSASARVPQRVRVPLQPAAFPQPGNGVLPSARACGAARARALRRHHRGPSAAQDATDATLLARHAGQPRPQSGRSTMAVRLNGEPWKVLSAIRRHQGRGSAAMLPAHRPRPRDASAAGCVPRARTGADAQAATRAAAPRVQGER